MQTKMTDSNWTLATVSASHRRAGRKGSKCLEARPISPDSVCPSAVDIGLVSAKGFPHCASQAIWDFLRALPVSRSADLVQMFDSTVVRAHVLACIAQSRSKETQASSASHYDARRPSKFPSNVAITAGFILIRSVQTASRLCPAVATCANRTCKAKIEVKVRIGKVASDRRTLYMPWPQALPTSLSLQ